MKTHVMTGLRHHYLNLNQRRKTVSRTVHAVSQWDKYYPEANNIVKVFEDIEDAKKYVLELAGTQQYGPDFTDIFSYEVN